MIKSLFAQASLTNPSTQETVVRDITEQPLSNTVASTVIDLRDVMKSKETALQKYVEQLCKAAELPDEQTIISMTDEELTLRNQWLNQLFTNFEEQIKRDYLILHKIRSDNILLANMNYSQLKDIHQLTNDYTQVQLEKAELLQKVDDLDITSKVAAIQNTLNELNATLKDKLTGLTQIVRPNTDQILRETNTKLKEALREAVKTNSIIVKKYDELSLHYSFMPQPFRDLVTQMKDEKDSIYLNQRHEPNSLQPTLPNPDLCFELSPVDINEGDLKKYLQRTASLAYDDLLNTQMDTNLAEIRLPSNNHVNANNHSYSLVTPSLRSEQEQSSSSNIEQSIKGKRCGQDPISPHPKQAKRDKPTVATQLPDTPNYPVITHRHTPIAGGHKDPRPFPYFVTNYEVVIYTMRTLQWTMGCTLSVQNHCTKNSI
jgi:hypothetical protein